MKLTEKMIAAITEIIETGADDWTAFQICDKYELNPAEESIVLSAYEDAKQELREMLEQEEAEIKEVAECEYSSEASEHFSEVPLGDTQHIAFGTIA